MNEPMVDSILESAKVEIVTIHIAMIARTEVLAPPPAGHLGCYASVNFEPFMGAFPGRVVRFVSEAGLAAEGLITCVENPGSCIRPDMRAFEAWYKLHWIPLDHGLLSRQIISTKGILCPKCSGPSSIIESRTHDGLRIRRRQCIKHPDIRWTTTEIFNGELKTNKPRTKGTSNSRPK